MRRTLHFIFYRVRPPFSMPNAETLAAARAESPLLDQPEEAPTIGMTAEHAQKLIDLNQSELYYDVHRGKIGTRNFEWAVCSHRNRNTNASGVHEQWGCGEGHYLYFDNGVLTSIQD
jgi:hypothetical protein